MVVAESNYEFSQVILDTSHNSVYDNRLRVSGRIAGTFTYIIHSAHPFAVDALSQHSQVIIGIDKSFQ